MKAVCTFTFPKNTGRDIIESAVNSEIFTAECVFGKPKVKVSGVAYYVVADDSRCVIDVSNQIGEYVAQVFTGIVMNTLGDDALQVRRSVDVEKQSGQSANLPQDIWQLVQPPDL